ncbi:MAG: hypothetical protein N2319_03670 [Candidatus Kapabacteria bacterium]|nr:hypothetical protein [Candidatus Kapabacteria bacterium]
MSKLSLFTFILIISINFYSCSLKDLLGPDKDNKFEMGEPVQLTSQTITKSGGKITITDTVSKLQGMEINIQQNSYPVSKTFNVSYAEIKNHNFGNDFNPITPVIIIDNGGGYSDEIMTVKIPIQKASNEFAMAFYYNDANGTLEGIPIIADANDYIIVGTRHFSNNVIKNNVKSITEKKSSPQGLDDASKIIVTKIIKDELLGDFNSGFEPGKNDWEVPNYGSYIAPGGFCTGASLTSMWYYYMFPNEKLYGKYESIPGSVWEDNKVGLRFSSEVWCDLNWTQRGKFFDFMKNLATTLGVKNDSLQYFSFAYSMKLSKQPQLIEIFRPGGGHAMVIYRCNNGELFVADPNYPANTDGQGGKLIRKIKLSNPKFNPYESKQSADDIPTLYPDIFYTAKTSLIEWEKLQTRWNEAYNNKQPSKFPDFKLFFVEGNEKIEITDRLNTDADSILLYTECKDCQSNGLTGLIIYDENGKSVDLKNYWVKLNPGRNRLGFAIYGKPTSNCNNQPYNTGKWKWLDFRWIEIYKQTIEIKTDDKDGAPIFKMGEANKEYKFIADGKGSFPKNVKFVWFFGETDDSVTVVNDSTIKYSYKKTGSFVVTCKVYDNNNNKQVAEARVPVSIGGFTRLTIGIADWTIGSGDPGGPMVLKSGTRTNYLYFMNAISAISPVCEGLRWDKNKFSATINCSDNYSYYTLYNVGSVQGELSADGKTLLTATFQITVKIKLEGSNEEIISQIKSITVKNVPLAVNYDHAILGTFGNCIIGKNAAKYVTSVSVTTPSSESSNLDYIDWETGQPELMILFK